jgi:hypothetical protein
MTIRTDMGAFSGSTGQNSSAQIKVSLQNELLLLTQEYDIDLGSGFEGWKLDHWMFMISN